MSDYEPGTVARIVLSNGVVHPVAFRLPLHDGGWATAATKYVNAVHVTDVRPLMVLDLPAESDRLVAHLRSCPDCAHDTECNWCESLADQIEAQVKPTKPAEPTGLGAVVEDAQGKRWVRTERIPGEVPVWDTPGCEYGAHLYGQISAVRVLSEGVS